MQMPNKQQERDLVLLRLTAKILDLIEQDPMIEADKRTFYLGALSSHVRALYLAPLDPEEARISQTALGLLDHLLLEKFHEEQRTSDAEEAALRG